MKQVKNTKDNKAVWKPINMIASPIFYMANVHNIVSINAEKQTKEELKIMLDKLESSMNNLHQLCRHSTYPLKCCGSKQRRTNCCGYKMKSLFH